MFNVAHGNIDDYCMCWSTLSSVLLHFGCYLPRIHICSSFLLSFYKMLMLCLSFFTIAWILLQNFAWISNLSCSGRILSSWESLVEVNMVCIIHEHNFCFYLSFMISFRLCSIVMLIPIIFTVHTSHVLYLLYYIICITFCWHLSRFMFGYCSKYEHS